MPQGIGADLIATLEGFSRDDGGDRPLSAGRAHQPRAPRRQLATSIYSKSDGLVPWEMCVEKETLQSENIEVEGATHRGLPAHPKVLEAITQRLAQPDGQWRRFGAGARLVN